MALIRFLLMEVSMVNSFVLNFHVDIWLSFLLNHRKKLYELLRSCTSILCERFGHRMEKLRVDFGTVERGAEFVEARSLLNSSINQAEFICLYRLY